MCSAEIRRLSNFRLDTRSHYSFLYSLENPCVLDRVDDHCCWTTKYKNDCILVGATTYFCDIVRAKMNVKMSMPTCVNLRCW